MPKILVIDDNSAQRETIQDALRSIGFETIEAENGTAGVDMARTHLPDLILCDVNMAQGDGYATLGLLRNEPVTANAAGDHLTFDVNSGPMELNAYLVQ